MLLFLHVSLHNFEDWVLSGPGHHSGSGRVFGSARLNTNIRPCFEDKVFFGNLNGRTVSLSLTDKLLCVSLGCVKY